MNSLTAVTRLYQELKIFVNNYYCIYGHNQFIQSAQDPLRKRAVQGLGPVRWAEFKDIPGIAILQKIGIMPPYSYTGIQALPIQPSPHCHGAQAAQRKGYWIVPERLL